MNTMRALASVVVLLGLATIFPPYFTHKYFVSLSVFEVDH